MPIAADMSEIINNPILRVGQTPSMDQAEEDLDISLDNLNQMIMELDPSFEPLPLTRHRPGQSKHTVSSPDDSPVDEELDSCVLVSRGCSSAVELDYTSSSAVELDYTSAVELDYTSSSAVELDYTSAVELDYTSSSAVELDYTSAVELDYTSSRAWVSPCTASVAIPQRPGSASPHGSVIFSDSPSTTSSRPPLPCGGGGGGGGGIRRRDRGTLSLSRSSLRGSGASLLSTSIGSDTSYIMGSCQSLLSDDTDSSPEGLTPSGSLGDVSRPHRPFASRQIHGVPLSPYLNSSPSGSFSDIPVVLINGAPEASLRVHPHGQCMRSTSRSPSPQDTPTYADRRPFHGSQPNMKFVMDTSQYWFQPQISREEAEAVLRDQDAGSFVVRDSTSYRGCFGLAMKVHPVSSNPASISKPDECPEPIRHFLIESSAKGVRVNGSSQEPYFGSLSALVYQHTISPFALPCKLVIHTRDIKKGEEGSPTSSPSEEPNKTACNFLYLCAVPTEMLTGPCAVQRAVSTAFEREAGPNPVTTPTVVNLKVSPKGVTLTDIQRKLFFRRHFPAHLLSYGGEDPEERRWLKSCKAARTFGIVAKGLEAGAENMCHVFAEYDPLQPCGISLQLIHNIIARSQA